MPERPDSDSLSQRCPDASPPRLRTHRADCGQAGGRREIGKALGQVDGTVPMRHPRHAPDDRLGEDGRAFAGLRHVVPTLVKTLRS